jgi:hypothetical protein
MSKHLIHSLDAALIDDEDTAEAITERPNEGEDSNANVA